ncbi:MAG: undecaprenyl/decaprenyl-phosphate alpha-N-acetylglucosaminyl 1-phosphate transferase [Myxococcales bacterium]|nr:undecaprenyl/decaprenyl-phosphate alpha-N-acetylglucosaminyl 1-phosphate transferase [Myxococcales bacterium]MCB9644587.1 undecaprenyl/decaprenyl-phosphate alpha-N-acetylglucosaminyl 1-phosphate transferase [Myxococcales bacterium]
MIYVVTSIVGLFLTLLLVFVVQKIAIRVGAISHPGGRSIHRDPTPLLGGLAIYVALVAISAVALFASKGPVVQELWQSKWKILGALLGATTILIVGIIDDIVVLRARTKLLGQFTAALVCMAFGFGIPAINFPYLFTIQLDAFGGLAFVFWVVAITNAVNLIDGMDGLASTVCFFASLGNGIIALSLGNTFIAFFSFMIAGSLLGFLFHNFPPAKIFLGDTGSMLLGFLLAVVVAGGNMQKREAALMIFAPLLLLAFSLLDVFLSVVRRFIRGKPIMSSDLGHIHHRLMRRFRNPRRVLVVVGLFSMLMTFVSIGTQYFLQNPSIFWLLLLVATVVLFFFVFVLGYFRVDRLRGVLETRREVKFLFSVLAYLPEVLAPLKTQEEVLQELNWVCHALRPFQMSFSDAKKNPLYFYKNPRPSEGERPPYNETYVLLSGDTFYWEIPTQNTDPTSCDLRLAWREIIVLFGQRLQKITASQIDNPTPSDLKTIPTSSSPTLHS